MTLIIHDMDQGGDDWRRARMGKPTASEFSTILAKGVGGGDSKTRRLYMMKLVGEIITGEPMENYVSATMERGKEWEAEARDRYALLTDTEPKLVGFIEDTDLRCGCSPDALIGENGLLEIKSAAPHILVEKIVKADFPPEHKAQVQGGLWLAQREWADILIHARGMKAFVQRTHRDEAYIKALAEAVRVFNDERDEMVSRYERYGAPSTLRDDLKQSILMAG